MFERASRERIAPGLGIPAVRKDEDPVAAEIRRGEPVPRERGERKAEPALEEIPRAAVGGRAHRAPHHHGDAPPGDLDELVRSEVGSGGGQRIVHPEDMGPGRGQLGKPRTKRRKIRSLAGEDQQGAAAEALGADLESRGGHPEGHPRLQEPGGGTDRMIGVSRDEECVPRVPVAELSRRGRRLGDRVLQGQRLGHVGRRQVGRAGRPRIQPVGERDRPAGDVVKRIGARPDIGMPEGGIAAAFAVFVHVVEELLRVARVLLEQHLKQPAFGLGARDHETPRRQRDIGSRTTPGEHRSGSPHRHLG